MRGMAWRGAARQGRAGDWLNTAAGEGLALCLALLAGVYVALLLAWGWVCHAYRQAGRAVAYRPGGEREL